MTVDRSKLDELQGRIGKKKNPCGVCDALAALQGVDLETLKLAVADYSPGVVAAFLEGLEGVPFTVSVNQAASHQRRTCVGFKP